jgi:polysaccharide biosynthesis/export protein
MNNAEGKSNCHCEHPEGARQSHLQRRDCFASLAMTILIVGFLLISHSIASAETDDYVIGDGDSMQISVWGSPELSVGATVRPDGKITLPAIGDVTASGFTPEDLGKKLSEKLEAVVKKPIVTVTMTGIKNSNVYVFGGGVEQNVQGATYSGVHFLPGRTTLLKFLCRLGNLRNADLKRTYIVRNGKRMDIDVYGLFVKGDLSKDILLKAEDMIYMPDNELNKIYVMGAVNGPKSIYYREGIRILDAILESGGFNRYAKENDVLILRRSSEGSQKMEELNLKVKDLMKEGDLSQNVNLMPGDFVIVKEGIF